MTLLAVPDYDDWIGSPVPRIGPLELPDRHMADKVESVSKAFGYDPMMPWQYHAAAWLTSLGDERDREGMRLWDTMETGVLVARQNGKTDLLERIALFHLMAGRRVLHLAHTLSLTMETFNKLAERMGQK